MSDALFIDASNFNVLFKTNGKFVLGLEYSSCPEKLITDAQSLGSSYDIYVSLWPRPEGEGDLVIPGLSHGRVPFVVLKKELKKLLDYVSVFPGARNIFICNALANFIIPARVGNFQVVLPYGARYALVEVKGRILDSIRMFNNQREFYDVMGEEFTCYGDSDITDVDSIRAQYPELSEIKKNILVSLIPLIVSYRSVYFLEHSRCLEIIEASEKEDTPNAETFSETVEVEANSDKVNNAEVEESKQKSYKPKQNSVSKGTFSIARIVPTAVFSLCLFTVGFGYSLKDVDSTVLMQNKGASDFNTASEIYQRLQPIYTNGVGFAGKASSVLEYVENNEIGIQLSRLEAGVEGIRLYFGCNGTEKKDEFIAYLEDKFVVSSVNSGDSITSAEGNVLQYYSVLVIV